MTAPGMGATAPAGVWVLPAQHRAVTALSSAVASGEVGHAWAFVGPRGVGQREAARALMAALNCPYPVAPGVPDGTCPSCDRALRGLHADQHEFAPTGAQHRVDAVRAEWLAAASRSGEAGGWKVLTVLEAERMNDTAANAFLKGLEEPPERTVWVLDVSDPDELPDTILSRCRTAPFLPWPTADLEPLAQQLGLSDPVDRALAVRAALGSPATLRRLALDGALDDLRAHRWIAIGLRREGPGHALVAARGLEDEVKRRSAVRKTQAREELAGLSELYGDSAPRSVVKQLEERQARRERETRTTTVQAALDDLVAWYRDCLLVAAGGTVSQAVHLDAGEALVAEARHISARAALQAIARILGVRDDLELNVQQGLALEALFMDIAALNRAT